MNSLPLPLSRKRSDALLYETLRERQAQGKTCGGNRASCTEHLDLPRLRSAQVARWNRIRSMPKCGKRRIRSANNSAAQTIYI
ncbi:hypothetical protein [Nostoc sp.]|uniref:hypothetical protein n=1 Tax=Nostoc sp. TaxID=1180 RepID=UPI002FF7F9FA